MTTPRELAVNTIRSTFEDLISHGVGRKVAGSSDAAIDTMAAEQNVPHVPDAVREMLRLIGATPGLFDGFPGTWELDDETKEYVLGFVLEASSEPCRLVDPERLLVIADWQGYSWIVIDGVHLFDPDPPILSVTSHPSISDPGCTVTQMFAGWCESVKKRRVVE